MTKKKFIVFACAVVAFCIAGCAPSIDTLPPVDYDQTLIASDGDYNDRISVSWKEKKSAAVYVLYRAITADGEYVEIGRTTGSSLADMLIVDGVRVLGFKVNYHYKLEMVDRNGAVISTCSDSGWIDDFVTIPDPDVRSAMMAEVPGKISSDKLYASELAQIISLKISTGTTDVHFDLEGIQLCVNLKECPEACKVSQ